MNPINMWTIPNNIDIDKRSLTSKRAQIESQLSIKAFETQLRKLYWSLVANEESLKITTTPVTPPNNNWRSILPLPGSR